MSIINLESRVTNDWPTYQRCAKSSDSLIYLDGELKLDDGPASLDLSVGEHWYDSRVNQLCKVPSDGLLLAVRSSIVLESAERIALPNNVFGIVTGKGQFIFQGVLISSGKVDPGFDDRLRIGLFNAGVEAILLKPGEAFCSCCFVQMETTIQHPKQRRAAEPDAQFAPTPLYLRVVRFVRTEWRTYTPWVFSAVAVGCSLWNIFHSNRK